MKIIILVPELEKRPPKKGEAYIAEPECGQKRLEIASCDFGTEYECFTRHKIEVPEGSDTMQYLFWQTEPLKVLGIGFGTIPIPQPKKKIKKWQWLYRNVSNGRFSITFEHYSTKEEAAKAAGGHWVVDRLIEESMIEVEE